MTLRVIDEFLALGQLRVAIASVIAVTDVTTTIDLAIDKGNAAQSTEGKATASLLWERVQNPLGKTLGFRRLPVRSSGPRPRVRSGCLCPSSRGS